MKQKNLFLLKMCHLVLKRGTKNVRCKWLRKYYIIKWYPFFRISGFYFKALIRIIRILRFTISVFYSIALGCLNQKCHTLLWSFREATSAEQTVKVFNGKLFCLNLLFFVVTLVLRRVSSAFSTLEGRDCSGAQSCALLELTNYI